MFKVLIEAIPWVSSLVGTVCAFICMAKCQKRYFQLLAYCAVWFCKHKFLIGIQKFYAYAMKQMKKVADKFQAIEYHKLYVAGTSIEAGCVVFDLHTDLISRNKDVVINAVANLFNLFNGDV